MRYDRLAANFLAFIKLAAIRLWPGVYKSTSQSAAFSYPKSLQLFGKAL
jgi:hypothetical protein